MVRRMIQLTEEQDRKLKEMAARQKASVASLVRAGIDGILASKSRKELWKRAMAAAGCGRDRDGASDVSAHVDKYLAEALWEDFERSRSR